MKNSSYQFSTPLIDVCRNATDDFNLFHDKFNWKKIRNNPFNGPIALGFQLLGLVSEHIKQYRENNNDLAIIEKNQLKYSYYQIKFAQVVTPLDRISVDVKKTQYKTTPEHILSNRFTLKTQDSLALIGFNKASQHPLILKTIDLSKLEEINQLPDRTFTKNNEWFIKHKFFTTSNAKNFLVGCQVEQSIYFDEINDKVIFPESFPLALSSCALLERATKLQHDFEKDPMIYISHEHCIDREAVNRLSSNEKMSMIVKKQSETGSNELETFYCFGLLGNNRILFRSILTLAPLSTLLKKVN